ncbi:MAG: hypothetical protein DRH57_08130 [Candidatus Cloacimonadota bacterium]|nr:MAG: hypothetical protein DRH57_08130 [Candidatus Cloacimonadota bacterium]
MKSKKQIQEAIKNGEMFPIVDNMEYNTLIRRPQLYALIIGATTRTIKMQLTGLYRGIDNIEYLTFYTDEEINGQNKHAIEYRSTTFDNIYDYDKVAVDELKNNFRNINRVAKDYGYNSLEDFLKTYNTYMEELPERMI